MNARFARDVEAMGTRGSEILRERKSEIENLYKAIKAERNGFRIKCIAQDIARRESEYRVLDSMI